MASQGLDASFFFTRREGDPGPASWFLLRTLVHQLFAKKVIDSDPLIYKALGEEFDKLIHQRLGNLKIPKRACLTLLMLLDALDEYEKEGEPVQHINRWSGGSLLRQEYSLTILLVFEGLNFDDRLWLPELLFKWGATFAGQPYTIASDGNHLKTERRQSYFDPGHDLFDAKHFRVPDGGVLPNDGNFAHLLQSSWLIHCL